MTQLGEVISQNRLLLAGREALRPDRSPSFEPLPIRLFALSHVYAGKLNKGSQTFSVFTGVPLKAEGSN
jgi:hypothetical protein